MIVSNTLFPQCMLVRIDGGIMEIWLTLHHLQHWRIVTTEDKNLSFQSKL